MVYIMEAHPVDAWQDEDNLKDNIRVASPQNLLERCKLTEPRARSAIPSRERAKVPGSGTAEAASASPL